MGRTIRDAPWESVQALHEQLVVALQNRPHVADAAQVFVEALAGYFSTIALARVFLVLPWHKLPAEEQHIATELARAANRPVPLDPATPTLALCGTTGIEPDWTQRLASRAHRAIPLIDKELVDGAPMVASLLASLKVDLAMLRGDSAIELRNVAGGINARFYVPDASSTTDAQGRHVIADREFVARHGIKTVFGMGGTYVNRMLAVVIVFTRELLEPIHVDRFPTFISTFKMATSRLSDAKALFG